MKKFLITIISALFSLAGCLLLCGCMVVAESNVGNKILENNRKFDAAILPLATEFYQDEQCIYLKAPVQTFREIHPGAALVAGEGYFEDDYKYYPLSPIQKKSVFLYRQKKRKFLFNEIYLNNNWYNWHVIAALPEKAKLISKPEDWFKPIQPEQKYMHRRQLVTIAGYDSNSFWRKTAAYSCMLLLDFPLSIAYTCTAGILAIPAFYWE